jgi:hypothetical protein
VKLLADPGVVESFSASDNSGISNGSRGSAGAATAGASAGGASSNPWLAVAVVTRIATDSGNNFNFEYMVIVSFLAC